MKLNGASRQFNISKCDGNHENTLGFPQRQAQCTVNIQMQQTFGKTQMCKIRNIIRVSRKSAEVNGKTTDMWRE